MMRWIGSRLPGVDSGVGRGGIDQRGVVAGKARILTR